MHVQLTQTTIMTEYPRPRSSYLEEKGIEFFWKAFLSTYNLMIDYDYFILKLHQFYPQIAYLGQFHIAK